MKRALGLVALLLLFAGAAAAWWLHLQIRVAPGPADAPSVDFTVAPGSGGLAVGRELASAGLVRSELGFRLWLRMDPRAGRIKAGTHTLSAAMTPEQIMDVLVVAPAVPQQSVTFLPGWTLRDADAAFAAQGLFQTGAYLEAAEATSGAAFPLPPTGAEGYLFPETYYFDEGTVTPSGLVERQLNEFQTRFLAHATDRIQASGRSLEEIVNVAAMVEREERTAEHQPLVAGIIWKRLDHDWALGIDATSRYPLDDWTDEATFRRMLRDPDDPWNTRLRLGLPPGPISNPGLSALEAALEPETSPYWYYLHDSSGTIRPARDQREHEANRARYGVY